MAFDDAGLVLQLGSPSLTGKPKPNPTTAHKHSLTLSLSGQTSCLVSKKREREFSTDDDDEDVGANERKKLRLTKGQSVLLEKSFRIHNTLSPKQKQELVRELKLRPRQVEVWFQNRRARSKPKQTEVDCEFLKKYCDTLTEENNRLQKELHELKAPAQPPVYMQFLAASLSMCSSCEKIGAKATLA